MSSALRRRAQRAPPRAWATTVLVAAAHAGLIAALLGPWTDSGPEPAPALPPLVLKLAPLAAPAAPAPPDVALAPAPAASTSAGARPRPAESPPPGPLPELAATARGTLAKATPQKPRPAAPRPPAPPEQRTPPDPQAPSGPAAPSAAQAAAPPPAVAEAPAAPESAAPAQGAATASVTALESWEAQVLARFSGAKRYPHRARVAREQDTVTVGFSVAPDGSIGRARIQRSAGYQSLEEEALALVARVSPLPPPPGGTAQQLSLPIDFYLRP